MREHQLYIGGRRHPIDTFTEPKTITYPAPGY